MTQDSTIDYLAIGHICYDLTPEGKKVGSTVAYSSRAAQVLGCRTAVLTSADPDYDLTAALPGIQVQNIQAAETTTFENVYTPSGRVQTLHAIAETLTTAHVPAEWQRAPIVHLGPIANEIEPEMIDLFSNSLIGLTPQGWMRRWDKNGRVRACHWESAHTTLPLAAAVIIGEEDLLDRRMLDDYRQWSSLLVLTQGGNGCTVFFGGESRNFLAPHVQAREFTGVGDIFATAYFIRLHQTAGNPWEAARYANEIAAQSVTRKNIEAKLEHLKQYQIDSADPNFAP